MQNDCTERQAPQLNYSTSTLHRALNHCGGVSTATREAILSSIPTSFDSKGPDIYVILPTTPSRYWKGLKDSLFRHFRERLCGSLTVKWNLYSKLGEDYAVRQYLEEAIRVKAKTVVISASVSTPELSEALRQVAKFSTVFLLNEPIDLVNAFYFGSDSKADLERLTASLRTSLRPGSHIFVIEGNPYRTWLFTEQMKDYSFVFRIFDLSEKIISSKIARALTEENREHPIDAVVCLDGICEEALLGIYKTRLPLPCYGFDYRTVQNPGFLPAPRVTVNQDLDGICRALTDNLQTYFSAHTCPDRKFTYIPSLLAENGETRKET